MTSRVIRGMATNNSIRVFIANTTTMVEKARRLHGTTAVASAALGRTMTATSMMGLMLKSEKSKITVRINGGGDIGSIVVVGNCHGNVKAYVANPLAENKYRQADKLDVGQAVGKDGYITIIKDLGLKEPYVGTSPLVSGEIAEDFASYFLHSEQEPSAVSLGVLVDRDHSIKAAGGFIIQVLPEADDQVLKQLEKRLINLEPITVLMDRGMEEEDILKYILGDMGAEVLEKYEVDFVCDCNKARLEQALISIGKKDLTEIIEEDGGAEIICHFCNQKYYFSRVDLEKLLNEIV